MPNESSILSTILTAGAKSTSEPQQAQELGFKHPVNLPAATKEPSTIGDPRNQPQMGQDEIVRRALPYLIGGRIGQYMQAKNEMELAVREAQRAPFKKRWETENKVVLEDFEDAIKNGDVERATIRSEMLKKRGFSREIIEEGIKSAAQIREQKLLKGDIGKQTERIQEQISDYNAANPQATPLQLSRVNLTADGAVTAEVIPKMTQPFMKSYEQHKALNTQSGMDDFHASRAALGSAMKETNYIPENFAQVQELLLPTKEEREVAYWTEQRSLATQLREQGYSDTTADVVAMQVVAEAMAYAPEEAKPLLNPSMMIMRGLDVAKVAEQESARLQAAEDFASRLHAKDVGAVTEGQPSAAAGPMGRELEKRQLVKREIPQGVATDLGRAKSYVNIAKDLAGIIKKYKKSGKELPTGPGEPLSALIDKWNILGLADKDRIALRSKVAQLYGMLYSSSERGKQLSDKEIALGEKMMTSMNSNDPDFIERAYEFFNYASSQIKEEITSLGAAGYETDAYKKMIPELDVILKEFQTLSRGRGKQYKLNEARKDAHGRVGYFQGYDPNGDAIWTKQPSKAESETSAQ